MNLSIAPAIEYDITKKLALRAGYAYGQSPVPSSTLHTHDRRRHGKHPSPSGAGYQWKYVALDVAYQYDLRMERHVGTSGLLSGEYSNSSTSVSIHTLALTARITF